MRRRPANFGNRLISSAIQRVSAVFVPFIWRSRSSSLMFLESHPISTVGHGVHGVEDQVNERLPDFALDSGSCWQIGWQFGLHLNHHSTLRRRIAPAGSSKSQSVWRDTGEIALLMS